MSTYRRAILAIIAATALPVLAPAAAPGNSLLSGYGGPGQGSEAILGSGLINGGGGGGSGGSRSSGGSGGSPSGSAVPSGGPSSSVATGSPQRVATPAARIRRRTSSPSRREVPPVAVGGSSSAGASTAYHASSEGGSQAVAVASDPLGISGADLAYVLVAAAALALTGLLTRQLTQTARKSPTARARFDRTPRH